MPRRSSTSSDSSDLDVQIESLEDAGHTARAKEAYHFLVGHVASGEIGRTRRIFFWANRRGKSGQVSPRVAPVFDVPEPVS